MIENPSLETATSGSIRFNADSSRLEIYNGEAWFEIDATSPDLQTGGTRGIRAGGYSQTDRIEFFNIETTGNAIDFGNLTDGRWGIGSGSDRTRAVFAGGDSPGDVDTIDYITIAQTARMDFVTIMSAGNAQDFGDMTATWYYHGGCSDSNGGIGE